MNKVIEAFGRWFASAAGVMQTFVACMLVVVAELARPDVDPHMFGYLLVLTIYSAITQPVLAFVGMLGARKTDQVLKRLEAMEQRELEKTDKLLELFAGRGADGAERP